MMSEMLLDLLVQYEHMKDWNKEMNQIQVIYYFQNITEINLILYSKALEWKLIHLVMSEMHEVFDPHILCFD